MQQALQDFFGAGFAVAAGDGEKLRLATGAAVACQRLQGGEGVGDDDLRQVRVWLVFGDDGGDGALPFGRGEEVFTAKIRPAQGDEQFARLQAAAVGADVQGGEIGAMMDAIAEGGDFGGGKRGVQRFCSHVRTVSWSE